MKALKLLNIKGFNVTIPHKVAILPFLDEIDETAKLIGAVNTVVNINGRLIGYNTDGNGYVESLQAVLTKSMKEHRYLIIGAGGAARAIYYTLASRGCIDIDVCNRTIENAGTLVQECPYEVNSKALSIIDAEDHLENYDVIIHTTSVGLHPNVTASPIKLEKAARHCVVSDIVYNPIKTKLLQNAEERGLITHNGVGMFVHQAALSFELWTAQKPNIKTMTNIVYDKLGGSSC